jgi:hypothetical protein
MGDAEIVIPTTLVHTVLAEKTASINDYLQGNLRFAINWYYVTQLSDELLTCRQ